jgi:hypothetical protein
MMRSFLQRLIAAACARWKAFQRAHEGWVQSGERLGDLVVAIAVENEAGGVDCREEPLCEPVAETGEVPEQGVGVGILLVDVCGGVLVADCPPGGERSRLAPGRCDELGHQVSKRAGFAGLHGDVIEPADFAAHLGTSDPDSASTISLVVTMALA